MRILKVNKCHAYSVGFDASVLLLDIEYDIEDKVKVAYVYNNYIIGNITHKKIYYTNKGAYIKYFGGRRIYLNNFLPVDFYGMEFRGSHK